MSDSKKTPGNGGHDSTNPFHCYKCDQIVKSHLGIWPKTCPNCGSENWRTHSKDELKDSSDDSFSLQPDNDE